jgi:hypothetical protein
MNYKTIRLEGGMVLINTRIIFNNIVAGFRCFVFHFKGLVTSAVTCSSGSKKYFNHHSTIHINMPW